MATRHVSRTFGPLHFEDLEPHRFEDLIRQLAHGFRPWRYLEATGRLGRDEGIDIRGVEAVTTPASRDDDSEEEGVFGNDAPTTMVDERVWRIQCKRYKEIGPKQMRAFVAEVVPDPTDAPHGVILAAACDVSAETLAAFRQEVYDRGVAEAHLWAKAALEDLLFRPEHDQLLFAYFGISLGTRRRSQVQRVREHIALKRKLLRALKWAEINQTGMADVLIRDIEDTNYPYRKEVDEFDQLVCPPWHVGTVETFEVAGLLVWRYGYDGWVREDGAWDIIEDARRIPGSMGLDDREARHMADGFTPEEMARFERQRRLEEQIPHGERKYIRELWWLPFGHIVEVDPIGDALHAGAHLLCRFDDENGPYVATKLFVTYGAHVGHTIELREGDRQSLFANPVDAA